jgi:D-glutamate cyclase
MTDVDSRVIDVVAENIDALSRLELRPIGYGHGAIHPLYEAAREQVGGPLAMSAARRLYESVNSGDVVLLTTGAGDKLNLPKGETDGPLGTAAVARILSEGIGAVPIVLTEAKHVDNVEATLVASGIGIRSVEEALEVPYTAAVVEFPAEESTSKLVAEKLLRELEPSAIIAIEKQGPNEVGVTHSATGMPKGPERSQIEHLIWKAQDAGILTIGVGDNGNEIGFGLIVESVWEHKQFGRVCQCPCGKGLATVVATDILVVAGTSNWGAYGIEAALAALLGRPDLIHSSQTEMEMLLENVRHGGVDASTRRQIPQVDGTSLDVQLALNELFRSIVSYGLAPPGSRRASNT